MKMNFYETHTETERERGGGGSGREGRREGRSERQRDKVRERVGIFAVITANVYYLDTMHMAICHKE